jgi:hypothetical protein
MSGQLPKEQVWQVHLNSKDYSARNAVTFQTQAYLDPQKLNRNVLVYVSYFSMSSTAEIPAGVYLRSQYLAQPNVGSSLRQKDVLQFIPARISQELFMNRFEYLCTTRKPFATFLKLIPTDFDIRLTDAEGNLLSAANLGDWTLGLTFEFV